jgi:hypothetical protein
VVRVRREILDYVRRGFGIHDRRRVRIAAGVRAPVDLEAREARRRRVSEFGLIR